jgi:hypothetical protein
MNWTRRSDSRRLFAWIAQIWSTFFEVMHMMWSEQVLRYFDGLSRKIAGRQQIPVFESMKWISQSSRATRIRPFA